MVAFKDIRHDKISSANHPAYRPDIDGMRAIAVLLVVLYHAFPALMPGGFIGVDVFFVISGFLISTIIFSGLERSSFSIFDFYKRRVNRIFPALLVVLSSCLIFGWFALFPDEYAQLGKHSAGGSGFISNIILWKESGYFDTSSDIKPLLHLWSLGIEEQFYIVFPVLAYLAWRFRVGFAIFVAAILLASFSYNIYLVKIDVISTFFLPLTRAWELLVGAFLACLLIGGRDTSRFAPFKFTKLLSLVGLFFIVASAFFLRKEFSFPGWWAVLPCLGSFMIIYAGPSAWLNRVVLSSKPFVWLGLISFPLYLWHWPLLSFLRIIEGENPSIGSRILMVFAAVALSIATFILVERPLKSLHSLWKPLLLAISMAVVGGTGYYIYAENGVPAREVAQATDKFNSQFVSGTWKYASNNDCISKYPLDGLDNYGWWFCVKNKPADPSVMIVGNSFANHLYPAIAHNEHFDNESILNIGTCSVDIMSRDIEPLNRLAPTSPCAGDRSKDQLNLIKNIITSSGSVKYVIISGLHDDQSEEAVSHVDDFVSFLEDNNVQPIIFIPHVTAYKDLKSCFSRRFKISSSDECIVPASERNDINRKFKPLLDSLAINHPHVPVFDQNDLYCDSDKCSLIIDGVPLFRDQYSHYSVYASEKLGRMFVEWAKVHAPGILSSE